MKHFYKFLFIAFVINSWRCAKFEEGHEEVCLRPFIEFVSYVIDSTKSIVTIKAAKITNGTLKSAKWNFNDGTSKMNHSKDSFTHAFPPSTLRKLYNIELEASNFECPESSKWYDQVSIPPCLAMPNFDAQISNNKVKFVNTSNLNNQKATYLWNFGNGNTSTSSDPTEVTYSTSGRKTVSLRIQTACGAKDTMREIFIPCTNKINCPNSSCIIVTKLQWNVFSFSVNNGISIVEWSFNDGTALERKASATHTFINPGTYNVIVKLTNECEEQFYSKLIVVEKPMEEYDILNLGSLPQNTVYTQISYYKNKIFVLRQDGGMYIGAPLDENFNPTANSNYTVNLSNKLKKDVFNENLYNISTQGVSKWSEIGESWVKQKQKKTENFISSANDIDCDQEGHFYVSDNLSSILYIPKLNKFVTLITDQGTLNVFTRADPNGYEIAINHIDNNSKNLILDIKKTLIYFSSTSGVICLNSNFSVIKTYPIQNYFNSENIKKILLDINGNLWSLSQNGKLYFVNTVNNETKTIWSSNVLDFDLVHSPTNQIDVIIAGNNLLKYLKRN